MSILDRGYKVGTTVIKLKGRAGYFSLREISDCRKAFKVNGLHGEFIRSDVEEVVNNAGMARTVQFNIGKEFLSVHIDHIYFNRDEFNGSGLVNFRVWLTNNRETITVDYAMGEEDGKLLNTDDSELLSRWNDTLEEALRHLVSEENFDKFLAYAHEHIHEIAEINIVDPYTEEQIGEELKKQKGLYLVGRDAYRNFNWKIEKECFGSMWAEGYFSSLRKIVNDFSLEI